MTTSGARSSGYSERLTNFTGNKMPSAQTGTLEAAAKASDFRRPAHGAQASASRRSARGASRPRAAPAPEPSALPATGRLSGASRLLVGASILAAALSCCLCSSVAAGSTEDDAPSTGGSAAAASQALDDALATSASMLPAPGSVSGRGASRGGWEDTWPARPQANRIGATVNESLELLESETENRSDGGGGANGNGQQPQQGEPATGLNNNQRLLARQLFNLVMNYEPEVIGENLQGVRIQGALDNRPSAEPEAGAYDASGLRSTPATSPASQAALVDDCYSDRDNLDTAECWGLNYTQTPIANLTLEQQQRMLTELRGVHLNVSNGDNTTTEVIRHCNAPLQDRPPENILLQEGIFSIATITGIMVPISFSIIIVVGLVGNIIVMLVILEERKTDRGLTPTGLLILDLSLADLTFIIFCIPFTGFDYYKDGVWIFGRIWCKFNQYLIVVCAFSSIYTLVLMSVDRFLAIVYPIECLAYRTSRNTMYAIYIKWITILIGALPTIQRHGVISIENEGGGGSHHICRFLSCRYDALNFQIIFFISSYLFPLILIFCLYLSLLNKLWYGNKPHGHKESVKTLESKKKVTWLVALIVIAFALCWCPIQVMLILMRVNINYTQFPNYLAFQVFAHTLGYTNSCINPIVYAFASESFTKSFKRSSMGRFCLRLVGLTPPPHPGDHDRSVSNFRTIHTTVHNNSNTNSYSLHNNQSSINSHHHVGGTRASVAGTSVASTSLTSGRNGGVIGQDGSTTISNQTPLTTPKSYGNDSNNRSQSVLPPLEPRDRELPPPPAAHLSCDENSTRSTAKGLEQHPQQQRQQSQTNSTPVTSITSSGASSVTGSCGVQGGSSQQQITVVNKIPAKQLVAHVAQSGNQVSHSCETCYQQDLIAP